MAHGIAWTLFVGWTIAQLDPFERPRVIPDDAYLFGHRVWPAVAAGGQS